MLTPVSPTSMILLGSALLTTGCSLMLAVQMRRVKHELSRCRTELSQRNTAECGDSAVEEEFAPDFSGSLRQATLKQRLQSGPDWRQPPERYRYAAALAKQGMDARGIAEVLRFPLEEAQQLIALKRAAQAQDDRDDGREG